MRNLSRTALLFFLCWIPAATITMVWPHMSLWVAFPMDMATALSAAVGAGFYYLNHDGYT